MTELELYKFINDNNIEWHRQDNDGVPDIIIFPYFFQMEEFGKLMKNFTRDGGLECRMLDNYFAIWMQDVCDYFGISSENVFKEKQ